MAQKPLEKLDRFEGDALFPLCAQRDAVAGEIQESMVGHGNSVGVTPEVFEDLLGSSKRFLGIAHPILSVEPVDSLSEKALRLPFLRQVQFTLLMTLSDRSQHLSSEKLGEDLDGKEIIGISLDPPLAIRGQSSAGDDGMDVRMKT